MKTPGSQTITATDKANNAIIGTTTTVVGNPTPTINSLSQVNADAAGSGFTLTVNGSNFVNGAVVRWNGVNQTTTFVSAIQLTATISSADLATVGTVAVTVFNPAPGGGSSAPFEFSVDSAATMDFAATPTTATLDVPQGGTATVQVTFSGSVSPSQVTASCVNLPAGATCSYNSSTGVVTIATTGSTPKGTYQITVIFTVAQVASVHRRIFFAAFAGLLPLPLAMAWIAAGRGGSRKRWAMMILLLLVMLMAACGGSGGGHTVMPAGTQTSVAVTLTVH